MEAAHIHRHGPVQGSVADEGQRAPHCQRIYSLSHFLGLPRRQENNIIEAGVTGELGGEGLDFAPPPAR